MTKSEFIAEMEALFATFGKTEYPIPRLDLIFDDVADLSRFEFRRIVKHFIQTKPIKFPPLPTHFNEEAQGLRKTRLDAQVERLADESDPRNPDKLKAIQDRLGVKSLADAIEQGKWK